MNYERLNDDKEVRKHARKVNNKNKYAKVDQLLIIGKSKPLIGLIKAKCSHPKCKFVGAFPKFSNEDRPHYCPKHNPRLKK